MLINKITTTSAGCQHQLQLPIKYLGHLHMLITCQITNRVKIKAAKNHCFVFVVVSGLAGRCLCFLLRAPLCFSLTESFQQQRRPLSKTLTRVTLKNQKQTHKQTWLAVWFEDLTELFPAGRRYNYIWFRGKQRVQIANGEVGKERNASSKQVGLRSEGGFKLK